MANNGVYYSSAHTLNFTTTGTTWATLTSGGTFLMNAVSATTYYNLPVSGLTGGSNISVTGSNGNYTISYTGTSGTSGDYLPLSGGTVTGATVFQSGLTANTFYTNYIDFNTSSTPVNNEGRLIWNNADEIGGLEVTMMSGNTILQIGEENLARVYNADTVTLTAGTVVYVFGSQGNTISVKRASNSGETTSSRALGVVSESIAVGARGFVNTFGLVKGLNTLAYSGGTPIWLGTTPGSWTSTEPDAPNHTVLIGFVSRSANSPNGSLFVHISNGWELNELHNVYAPSPSDGNVLKYSAATSVWVNSNTINLNGVSASTISATTYQNLPQSVSGGGTSNYISKWTGSTGLGDSQIVDDGSQVYIGANGVLNSLFSVVGPVGVNEFQIQAISSSLGITDTDLTTWTTGGSEIAIGGGAPLAGSQGSGNVSIGYQSMTANSTGVDNVAVGRRSLGANQAGQANVAIGYRAGGSVDSGSYNVFIGYDAGFDVTTEDNRLYIANNTYGTLIYGEFDNQIVNINGTLSATTYDNLPGSSSANCFTTFYVTNISGCSPVNVLSPLNVKDGLSVTGTSTFINQVNFDGGISASTFSAATYQNLPFYNAGLLTNSDQWINNNDGTVTLPSAYAALYNQTTYPSVVEVFLISSGTSGTHFPALSNNDTNYIVIDYSGGTPSWNILTDNSTINGETIVLTHIIYRANNFLHVLDFGNEGVALPNKINDRIVAVDRFGRESGFSLGLSGSGVVTLTSGVAWNGTIRQSLVAVNSQDDIFFQVYHTGGTWTYTTSANTLNNLYYDNGTNPVLATGGKYLVNWYFRGQEINDHLYEVWGVDEYDSVSEAQLSTEPNLPELITSHAFLTGRIIVQVSATTGSVESAFVQAFQPSTVQAHNDLTSIQGGQAGEYYHLTSSEYSNLSSFKNIQIDGVTQFSSTSLTDNLNFSGINITITSAATNTLVFSAGTGGPGGGVTSVTAGSGLSGNSTTGNITLINTQVQGITGITASSGISASTSNNVVTLTNTGVTGITAGTNITINQSTGNVTINSTGGGTSLGSVYTTANNFNFL